MWSYKDHGKSYEAVYESEHPSGFRWLHESFGTNWRMTEIQAAIGRIQLRRMAEWRKKRQANARAIDHSVKGLGLVRSVNVPDYTEHAEYKHYLFIRPEYLKCEWTRDRIVEEISRQGVPVYQGSCSEVYLEKAFDGTPWRPKKRLANAVELGETSLMFLVHPTLTDAEIRMTCAVAHSVLLEATK